ncbi:MAG: hypothetical protein Q8L52_02415 [bacterium]|nr:hypothetical protein [bacterium]
MNDEKFLPLGEPTLHFQASPAKSSAPVIPVDKKSIPTNLPGMPSQKQQQWGVVISIAVIVLMIIIGAFYAWGQRIAQNQYPAAVTE